MKTNTKATPSWYATESAGGHQGVIADENDPSGRTIALTYDPKDAAPICRAVNSHRALVKAATAALHLLDQDTAEWLELRAALREAR